MITTTVKPAAEPTISPPDSRLDAVAWDASDLTRPARIRATVLALVSTVALLAYLVWVLQPGRMGNPWLFGLLLAAELFNMVQALGFWWTCLVGRRRPVADPRAVTLLRPTAVDVFIPTYSEPVDIVRATIAAASELTGAEIRVALLDDGNRAEMAELAAEFGVRYVRRTLHQGAKAGNINHALTRTDAEFVLILDCDHVPRPDMVERMLASFGPDDTADTADSAGRVAYVQTPQYYANAPDNRIAGASWSQQALFFGAIARGKDRHGAMFCCGTNVLFRRDALTEVGGFPEGSLTEDFTLSVRLHEKGWQSRYLAEVLASGLGPEDLASYVSQQRRWARGCVGTLPAIIRSSLPLKLKAQYMLSASYFLTGWTVLIYLCMPVVFLLTGAAPLNPVGADSFLLMFAPYIALSLATVTSLGAGSYTFAAYSLAMSSFWIHVGSSLRTLLRDRGRFVVTPKSGSRSRQWRPAAPALIAVAVLALSAAWGLTRGVNAAVLNNVAFALIHIVILSSGVAVALLPSLAVTAKPAEQANQTRESAAA